MADEGQLLGRLIALLSDITGVPPGELGPHSTQQNTRGWDSVANLSFVASIEEEFGVSIPTATVMRLRSVADVLEFLEQQTMTSSSPSRSALD